jgi:hypothetical protein
MPSYNFVVLNLCELFCENDNRLIPSIVDEYNSMNGLSVKNDIESQLLSEDIQIVAQMLNPCIS